jgi:hypothetical protein
MAGAFRSGHALYFDVLDLEIKPQCELDDARIIDH